MEGLPLLPGYSFNDVTRAKHHVAHNCVYINGYPVMKPVHTGIGETPLDTEGVRHLGGLDPVRYDPSLTYGRTKTYVPPVFKPHFVLYDKKCLSFKGFFKQGVENSPDEHYRVRKINLVYFLEDDSLMITEPPVENAGFPQGRLVTRGKIPKNTSGELFHWKDLNNGIDLAINGIVFHICSCDNYTREYLISQGVDVEPNEPIPNDPYTERRQIQSTIPCYKTPSEKDNFYKFLAFEKNVLCFLALWDDRESPNGTLGRYRILYHLQDDKIEIVEIQQENCGKYEKPLMLAKTRIPKNWKSLPNDFPSAYLEKNVDDYDEYYSPEDLVIGNTLFIFGRRFLLIDCDKFTRNFYKSVYNVEQPKPIEMIEEKTVLPKMEVPPYTGFGTVEDSLQSFYSFAPQPPKKDVIRYLLNMNKKLRYTAVMDVIREDDKLRRFIIEYRLSDGNVVINELKVRNTGFTGGKFLSYTLIPKPGTDPSNPEYYTPCDFNLGSMINVFGHRFIITGVDLAVYRYMEANPEKFKAEQISETRRHLVREGLLVEDVKEVADYRKREEILEPDFGQQMEVKPVRVDQAVLEHPKPKCLPENLQY